MEPTKLEETWQTNDDIDSGVNNTAAGQCCTHTDHQHSRLVNKPTRQSTSVAARDPNSARCR